MIALLAMPEDPAATPEWWNRQLLGQDLAALVGELRVVHRPGPTPRLSAVLGDAKAAFLAGGFAAIPSGIRRELLRNPDLLPELAELVFAEGGNYWFGGPLDPLEQARAEKVAANVRAALRAEPRRGGFGRWAERAAWAAAVAAAVTVAVFVTRQAGKESVAAGPGWGFAKIAGLPRTADAKAVYGRLADLADEWKNRPTDDRVALAQRLTEFRLGCSTLQAATDLPLSAGEAAWLKLRCTDWAAAIDGHLRDLDATGDVAAVRTAAAATAAGIASELRERTLE